MDIASPKKSRLLYQRGDKKTQGVIDLRSFGEPQKILRTPATGKVFYEIKAVRSKVGERDQIVLPAHDEKSVQVSVARDDTASSKHRLLEKLPSISLPRLPKLTLPAFSLPHLPALFHAESAEREIVAPLYQIGKLQSPNLLLPRIAVSDFNLNRSLLRFTASSLMIPVIIFTFSFAQLQLEEKGKVLGESTVAYDNLKSAAQYALVSDFENTGSEFGSANANFAKARETIDGIGLGIGDAIGRLPVNTPISTAQNLTAAGENISLAGQDLSEILKIVSARMGENNGMSLAIFSGMEQNFQSASLHLSAADQNMQGVDTNYIPADMQDKIKLAKETLPAISKNFAHLVEDYPLLLKMLGSERPQKYLLLFENNTEMRATGGFIGSYGILDIENGKLQNLKIDGIFNPDGQLKEKIVPPMPIQKISASWSMHDSNWFADFPTSAKKTALFYEKTGGPTVDGVIAITPEVLKKLLEITGPIEMPAYGVTIDKDNFVAQTQNQVEDLYDKKINQPKRILSDLAPLLLGKLFADSDADDAARTEKLLGIIQRIEESLQEKQILIYHRDEAVENMLQKRGWAGELIQNSKGDYLAVINSNINGYKTDAVIEESIRLETEIQADGSIIDTLTVKRKHNGGDEQYDWYNRVNTDYMRVYVPKGSVLLSATGGTAEEYNPPMDYKDFKTDPDVVAEENTIRLDPDSKTQIFEESGKTVFGNWVYVSPKEEVTVVYRYQLPFKADFAAFTRGAEVYSNTVQKQAGSVGSNFNASVKIPENWKVVWSTSNIKTGNNLAEKLSQDLIYATIFTKS